MSHETFPVLLMTGAFFLTFLVPVADVSILGQRRLALMPARARRMGGPAAAGTPAGLTCGRHR